MWFGADLWNKPDENMYINKKNQLIANTNELQQEFKYIMMHNVCLFVLYTVQYSTDLYECKLHQDSRFVNINYYLKFTP